jgi:tRNA pseudouridine(55) synthase
MSEDKEYVGTFVLGVTTDTQDREGEVIQQRPVPPLDENQIRAAFEKFRGDFYQLPPMVSAKKHGGVPLYKLAREGKSWSASHASSTSIATQSTGSHYPKSISACCAAKAFMSAPMFTTSAKCSVAAHI